MSKRHSGLCHPRSDPSEDGRLRLHALLAADVPDASADFAPLVYALSIVAIVYTSLVALVQEDIKKLIAYSSIAHMGYVTMGLFTLTQQGVQGAMFQMISHGIVVVGALFLCVGVIYDRMHTREIAAYGGLVNRMPLRLRLHALHHGQCRPAGHVGLHRRVPDARSPPSRPIAGSRSSPRPASSFRHRTLSISTVALSSARWRRRASRASSIYRRARSRSSRRSSC